MIHCLTSDTDPMRPTETTLYTGETCKFTGRKPLICWVRKNPMSHLSRMKNPGLPLFVHSSGPAGLRLHTASLDVRTPWEPLLPSPAYLKLRFTPQLGLADRLPCACCVPYLNHPLCAISCIDHCHIRHASTPPKAYRRRKGDSSINHRNTKASGILCVYFGYLLCLG